MKITNTFKIFLIGFFAALIWAISCAFTAQAAENDETLRVEEVRLSELPQEARGVLRLIKSGGPFLYSRDGITFNNREGRLPNQKRGYYREYTVPTPGAKNRGARRIIAGKHSNYFYTDDHYRSFRRIKE